MANSSPSANTFLVPEQQDTWNDVVHKPDAHDGAVDANEPKKGVPEIPESSKKQEQVHVQYTQKCGLKIQVVDETALIETPLNVNGKFNRNRGEGKKPKRKGGKGKRKKKIAEEGFRANKGKKRVVLGYRREEMEALRFNNLDDQKKKWMEAYCGLGACVAREYDGLLNSANILRGLQFDNLRLQESPNLDAVVAKGKENHLKIIVQ